MDKTIKVAFDPTDQWSNDFFREFIKNLIVDEDKVPYEVYLVTTNPDITFINNVVTESGINVTNVNQMPNNTALVARLNTLGIHIYLSQDNVLCNFVNNSIPLQLVLNNITGCVAVVMNNIFDTYLLQQKWITKFFFWQDQIQKKI